MVLTGFQILSIVLILGITLAGGALPILRLRSRQVGGFALGSAFAAGVFLALSLLIMLPNGMHLLQKTLPGWYFPLAPFLSLLAFVFLLMLEHVTKAPEPEEGDEGQVLTPIVPVVMTVMIAIPSFLLGTALGISDFAEAVIILVAILAHKGSAGFALALAMMRSSLKYGQVIALYLAFALATPLGILLGQELHIYLTGETANLIKGIVLSLAAGVFLFMGTLHEQKHSPLIISCCTPMGFALMLFGLLLTAGVRLLLGLANHMH
ncbi:MAG: ZIP family metal transporter [Verrucomicrobiota bacterium]